MKPATAPVFAHIDASVKRRALRVFKRENLTMRQGVELALRAVARENRLPEIPNAKTRKAIADAEAGRNLEKIEDLDAWFASL